MQQNAKNGNLTRIQKINERLKVKEQKRKDKLQKKQLVKALKGSMAESKRLLYLSKQDAILAKRLKSYEKEFSHLAKVPWYNRLKDRYFPAKTYLINMELRNGMHKFFMVCTTSETFKFQGGEYLIDSEQKYFLIGAKCYALDYSVEFCLPIKRKLPVSDLKKSVELCNMNEVEYAINPKTLHNFITAEISKGVMSGSAIDSAMKQQKLMIAITMIATVVLLILFVVKTGMLNSVGSTLGLG